MKELVDVNKDNYFENTGHMSVSKFKKFLKCQVDGLQEFNGSSTALLVGSFVDAHVEGTLEQFKLDHPELISTRGVSKGKLKAEFKEAEEICDFIDNNKVLQQFLSGEKQQIFTGEISGVPFKIMMDNYDKGIAINDLKCMRGITDRSGKYYDFITQWRYDIQGACYQEIVRQVTGEQLPFFICVVTKETPINSAVIQIPQPILDLALEEVTENIEKFYDVWVGDEEPVGCGTCKSCISARKETPIMSMYDLQGGY